MERAHNKEEHAHDRFVAGEGVGEGELDLGLDFVRADGVPEEELEEEVVEGEERENEEEEDDVVAVEDVVGLGGGVIEPEGLRRREGSAQGGFRVVEGGVRQHRRWRCGETGGLFAV